MATKWLLLADFFFDSRTTRISKGEVTHPSYTYEARLLSAGHLDKSIPVPSGLYQGSDCSIEIAETDRGLRNFLASETPLRRLFELRLMPEGGSKAAYGAFGTFEIPNNGVEFLPGKLVVNGRDITWAWIEKPVPGLGNRTNFPWLAEGIDEFFFPILQGILESPDVTSPTGQQGVVKLPYMGVTQAGSPPVTVDRWALAQTPIVGCTAYRKKIDEGVFTLFSPSEYDIHEEEYTFNGITYDLSFLDCHTVQDPGTEIRVDAEGIWFRGEFGSMAAVGPSSPLAAIRNPVDFLINMLYGLLSNETRIPRYNIDSFDETRTILETVITSTSPPSPYLCDGAITESLTAGEFLGRFLRSFELDLFVNRYGELTVGITTEEDPDRPVFSQGPVFGESTDNSLILINSVRQWLANPHVNQLHYSFGHNYATKEWNKNEIFDNEEDQLALGGTQSPAIPEIVKDTLQLWFVRDEDTAEDVVRRRMEYLALGSYRIEFQAPLPEVYDDVELAKLIGVTTHWGLASGGFHNVEFKTTGLTYELDRFMCTIRGILRVPYEILPEGQSPQAPGFWVVDQGMKGANGTFERSEFYYNTDDYDEGERHLFGGVVSSNDPVNSHDCFIVDAVGTVVGTITVPPNVTGEERQLLQPQEWFPHSGAHHYKCRMGDFGSNGDGIPGIGDATWACLICEPRRSAGWTKARLTYDMSGTLEQGPVGPDGEDKEDGTGYIGIAFDSSDIPESAIPPDLFQQRPERYGTFQRVDSRWANKISDIRWETVHGWGGLGLGIVTTESFIHLLARQEATVGFHLIAHTGKGGSPTTVTTDAINTTGANLIILSIGYYFNVSNVDPVLSDNKGNTYTPLPLRYAGDYLRIRHFYKVSPTVGTNHTFTASPGFGFQNFGCLHAAAFSGARVSPVPYDQQDGEGAASGVTIKPTGAGTLTPSVNNCLIVTSICDGFTGTRTVDDGNFSVLDNVDIVDTQHFGGALAYAIQTTLQAVDPQWTGSPDNGGLVATISTFIADPGATTDTITFHRSTAANVEEDPIDHNISSGLDADTEDGGEYYCALTRAQETTIIRSKGYKSQIHVLVSGVTSSDVIEFPYTISRTWADSDDVPIVDRRQVADLRGAVAAYFEITGLRIVAGGHSWYLYDMGTSDSGTSGTRIAASALEFTEDGRQTIRTTDILAHLTHLNRYGVDYDDTDGGKGWITGSAKLIIARQGGSVALP